MSTNLTEKMVLYLCGFKFTRIKKEDIIGNIQGSSGEMTKII